MSKTVQVQQNNFSGGISDDVRKAAPSEFIISKHFDIFSNPNRITPYRSLEADTETSVSATDLKQYVVKDFLYSSTSTKLYGLGQNGTGLTKILQKDDATTGLWTKPASSEGNAAVKYGCLVEYKDYLWGFQGTNQVWKWGLLSGTPSITNSAGTIGTVYNTVTAVTINAAGTGYNINDVLVILSGNNSCKLIVTTVSGTTVTGVTILEPGYNQVTTTGSATSTTSAGTGCTINITTVANTTATITSVAQGLIAKDDNLYLPYNNIIARVYPSGTVQDQVLKLPTNLKITSICNFGNYMAIGTAPISLYNGVSRVFLWNLYSADVQESIDWGEGELRVLETIEGGFIVGISDRWLNNSVGAGKGSMIIQVYSGGVAQVVKEVFTQALVGKSIPISKAVRNNRLFFASKLKTNSAGTEYVEGLWSFGRKNVNYGWALTCDIVDSNISTSGIDGFGIAGNYFFIAHSGDGSVLKTNDSSVYTTTSSVETQILNFGAFKEDKQLKSLEVSFAPLTSGQVLTAKYKIDEDSSWTTIGTFNTIGEVSHTFRNIESTGAQFASGREFRFLLESTGGLEITEWSAIGDVLITP